VVEGPLGHEQERAPGNDLPNDKSKIVQAIRAKGNSLNDPRYIDSAEKCLPAADPRLADYEWVTDTYRQYRLIFGTRLQTQVHAAHPIHLVHSDDSGHDIALPVTAADADASCTHFHRFDKEFLIWDCSDVGLNINYVPAADRWHAKHDCWPVWRVMPATADVERICLPYGPWVGSSIELVPTKMGLLFASLNDEAEYPNGPGAAGLYELAGGTAHRILTGLVRWPTISPSGCKVVFDYADSLAVRYPGRPGSPTIIVTDL